MKEFILPSGAKLKVNLAPFNEANDLLKAILKEVSFLKMEISSDVFDLSKTAICRAYSSAEIESAFKKCAMRSLYNGLKIDESIFESEASRGDYIDVFYNVCKENIGPFTNGLFAKLGEVSKIISGHQA